MRVVLTVIGIFIVAGAGFFAWQYSKIGETDTLATFSCQSGFEWQVTAVHKVYQDPELGWPSFFECASFSLLQNTALVFNTGGCDDVAWTSTEFSKTNAYHRAIAYLRNGASDDSYLVGPQAGAIQNKSNAQIALECLYANLSPGDTVGNPDNFPKTIPLPKTSGFITVLPGQEAIGSFNGTTIALVVDAGATYGNGYSMLINGVASSTNIAGGVLITVSGQNADASTKWDITYPNANGQYGD